MRGLGRLEADTPLDFDTCVEITAGFMQAQGWRLVDAHALVELFWSDLQNKGLRGRQGQEAVETAVWQNYAAVMYDTCRQPDHAQSKQAWTELQRWLEKRARSYMGHAQEREEVVQEALISLLDTVEKDALQAPRALWAYALRVLSNARSSRHRWHAAQKRGADKVESLQAEEELRGDWSARRQPISSPPGKPSLRPLEETVINRERRRQLQAFFEQHLKSDLQVAVAIAFYLHDQTPSEIAALMGRTAHEVRMIKARALQALRALPQAEMDRLQAILGAPVDEKEDEFGADG